MRIRILRRPPIASVDGLRLDSFEPGHFYDVGTALECLFLASGWAEPVANEGPALLTPLPETVSSIDPPNLIREKFPPYLESQFAVVLDRRRRRRR